MDSTLCEEDTIITFIKHLLFFTDMSENKVLAFNTWDTENIEIEDPGLERYISLDPVIVPKTGARYAGNRFHKSDVFIVERLINKVMVSGHKGDKHLITSGNQTGKAAKVYEIVEQALNIVEEKTNTNPIEALVKGIENGAPREEIVTVEYGGARYPKAVEASPQRRVDVTLRQMAQGAKQDSFDTPKSIEEALADEIINAFRKRKQSQAVKRKLEIERQADASR